VTGRERILAALNYAAADRVPTMEVCLPRAWVEKVTGRGTEDPWRALCEVADYLDADAVVMPVGVAPGVDCVGLEAPEAPPAAVAKSGRGVLVGLCGILCRVVRTMRWEEVMRIAVKDRRRFRSLSQAARDDLADEVELSRRRGYDAIVVMDDIAGASGLLASPGLLRALLFDCYREWLAADRSLPPVLFHSDGNIYKAIADIADAGFAGVHGCEEAAGMNVAELVWSYRGKLVFAGGFSAEAFDGAASAEQGHRVAEKAKRCASGGGYIGGSDGGITGATAFERLRALHETFHRLALCEVPLRRESCPAGRAGPGLAKKRASRYCGTLYRPADIR